MKQHREDTMAGIAHLRQHIAEIRILTADDAIEAPAAK
jgi:hypothetical protein